MNDVNARKAGANLAAGRFVANTQTGGCPMNPRLYRGKLGDRAAAR